MNKEVLEVGQEVFVLSIRSSKMRYFIQGRISGLTAEEIEKHIKPATITKIGRRYVTCKSGYNYIDFDVSDDFYQKCGKEDCPFYKMFLTKEQIMESYERAVYKREIKYEYDFLMSHYNETPLEKIIKIRQSFD